MRVTPASFKIIESDLRKLSIAERIEKCGRICYKSEAKITSESAIPFVAGIIKGGHNSVLEMACVTLSCRISWNTPARLSVPFIAESVLKGVRYYTGSVRAWREAWGKLPDAFRNTLLSYWNEGFSNIPEETGQGRQQGYHFVNVDSYPVDGPDRLLHEKVAVKLITNRAVTHEIVRHRPCSFLQESQRYCRYDKEQFGAEVTFIKPMFFDENDYEYSQWRAAMEMTECIYLKLLETSTPQAARTVLPNSCKTEIIVYATLHEWRHIFKLRTSQAAEPSMREIMVPLHTEFVKMYPKEFQSLRVSVAGR